MRGYGDSVFLCYVAETRQGRKPIIEVDTNLDCDPAIRNPIGVGRARRACSGTAPIYGRKCIKPGVVAGR
jgi:hypothetical protein